MTPRQRRIIGVLVVANMALVGTVLFFVARSPSSSPVAPPTTAPTAGLNAMAWSGCQRRAVDMLSQAGLGGTVTLVDGVAQFKLLSPVAQSGRPDELGQQVWLAFDVALALTDAQCDTFTRIDVQIEEQAALRRTRVSALVDLADLEAFHDGQLDEASFIDRVQYRVEHIDGG